MGYTHYYTPKAATDSKWEKFVTTCKTLHKNLPKTTNTAGGYHENDKLVICGGIGTGLPQIDINGVIFNGNKDKGLDHETLWIKKDELDWSFTKTARKPYDLLVCAVLIAANEILGYDISSDGDFEDWKPAINYYLRTIYSEMPKDKEMKLILPEFLHTEYVNL